MAAMGSFASPAPTGASPYVVATERLVLQLSAAAELRPAALLGDLPGAVPQLLPGRRWTTDLPAVEAGYVQAALTGSNGVDYVSAVEAVHSSGMPSGVVPDSPCYSEACGPTAPVRVENPSAGRGATVVHPDGQSDLWAVNAPEAWSITRGSANVVVAVLDTGVDLSHVQLADKVTVGPDVCADDRPLCASPGDNNGHGTFVTGLIAANTNDGIGMASLGWDTRALDIKVLDDQGKGNTMDEATGIYDAVADGARVINLSLTNEPCSLAPTDCGPDPDSEAAVEYAVAHGVVVVSAAGNFDSTEPVYPASYPGVLSVAASTDQALVDPSGGGAYLDFSEYGEAANIAAPGIDVLSTWDDGNYAVESGTSMGAPHVAAAAALVIAADPALSGPQVTTILRQTALPLGTGSSPIDGGFLNAGAAVEAAASHDIPRTLDGYQLIGANGSVYNSGVDGAQGSLAGDRLAKPVVGGVERSNGLGYWLVASDGGVFAFGDARFYGSTGNSQLNKPIVAMAATPDGLGYWLVASDGGVFAFGDARFYGREATGKSFQTIVGIAPSPYGRGYWLAGANGKVYAFGSAPYEAPSSTNAPVAPIVAISA
jgi:subtilisin family serine protease